MSDQFQTKVPVLYGHDSVTMFCRAYQADAVKLAALGALIGSKCESHAIVVAR